MSLGSRIADKKRVEAAGCGESKVFLKGLVEGRSGGQTP